MRNVAIVIVCAILSHVQTYKLKVAPEVICADLNPIHVLQDARNYSEPLDCPFKVTSNCSYVEIGWSAIITVSSTENLKFRGFLLQAKYGALYCGTFVPQKDVQLVDCQSIAIETQVLDTSSKFGHLAIYLGKKLRSSFELVWIAPTYLLGEVDFYLSPIIDGNKFWIAVVNEGVTSIKYTYKYHPEDAEGSSITLDQTKTKKRSETGTTTEEIYDRIYKYDEPSWGSVDAMMDNTELLQKQFEDN